MNKLLKYGRNLSCVLCKKCGQSLTYIFSFILGKKVLETVHGFKIQWSWHSKHALWTSHTYTLFALHVTQRHRWLLLETSTNDATSCYFYWKLLRPPYCAVCFISPDNVCPKRFSVLYLETYMKAQHRTCSQMQVRPHVMFLLRVHTEGHSNLKRCCREIQMCLKRLHYPRPVNFPLFSPSSGSSPHHHNWPTDSHGMHMVPFVSLHREPQSNHDSLPYHRSTDKIVVNCV